MNNVACILLVLIINFFTWSYAFAGPFGTEMGYTLEELKNRGVKVVKKIDNDTYEVTNLPKEHSSFNVYNVAIGENGLYKIIAASKKYKNDKFGLSSISEYKKIKEQLTSKCGIPSVVNEKLLNGAIYSEPHEFVPSLYYHERVHFSIWHSVKESNIKKIFIGIIPLNSSTSFVFIEYDYNNIDLIDDNKRNKEVDSL